MSISTAWNKLFNDIKGLRSDEYYSFSSGINIPIELVTPQWIKPDSMGNEIAPGDIVALDKSGKYSGCMVGILLGWTEQGYRVAGFRTQCEQYASQRVIEGSLRSPHQVFLVKSMNSTVLK
ncbi:hypothetical protein KAALPHA_180 [Klebsiella phage vB_KaeM_KaAlpha]|uniref:Uncharacterized protein n=1 Tax=Klebsiella phage vB_KaeM_KaAlpha TaxID=2591367 RepID=A0A5B9NGL8_9CAUD|nr:hypothetical protein KAALPHA_180 [Klebsiella phage vB_KaeM_KaAlpha]